MSSRVSEPRSFAELYCRSKITFLVGASQPEALVRRAAAKMYSALALTDECSLSGVHFIVGSELLSTAAGPPFVRVVVMAQDRNGYGNLCELITLARPGSRRASLEPARTTSG